MNKGIFLKMSARVQLLAVLIALLVIGVIGVSAQEVFEDAFNNSSGWVVLSPAVNPLSAIVDNGSLVITAKPTNNVFYKHSKAFTDFTFSVKLSIQSIDSNGCGILFGIQPDGFQCFSLSLMRDNSYVLGKWVKSGNSFEFKTLVMNWNSFVTAGDNVVAVGRKGSDIYVYCNGVLLEKYTDAQYPSGDVGLYVGPGERCAFDHAYVTSVVVEGKEKISFADTFDDGKVVGWRRIIGAGSIVETGGALEISADQNTVIYTSGKYTAVGCTAIVKYISGPAAGVYGISYLNVFPNVPVQQYTFIINHQRQFSMYTSADVTGGVLVTNSAVSGERDTLVIGADYSLTINGKMMEGKLNKGFSFNSVGFTVGAGVKVAIEDVRIGTDGGLTIVNKPGAKKNLALNRASYKLGGCGIVVDSRGRKVAEYRDGAEEQLKSLGNGSYFIIPNDKRELVIQRAIINLK